MDTLCFQLLLCIALNSLLIPSTRCAEFKGPAGPPGLPGSQGPPGPRGRRGPANEPLGPGAPGQNGRDFEASLDELIRLVIRSEWLKFSGVEILPEEYYLEYPGLDDGPYRDEINGFGRPNSDYVLDSNPFDYEEDDEYVEPMRGV